MALTLCPKLIADNISINCDKPIFTGLEPVAYIINKEDISSITYDANNKHIVKAITLTSPAKAYKIYNPFKSPMNGTQTSLNAGDVSNKFDNAVGFIVPDDGPGVAKDIIDPLANGEFVVIVANKWENTATDNKFQIYGMHRGLRATALDNGKYAEETDGGHAVTLTETGAPSYGYYFFDTDVATSRAALEALC